MNNIFLTIGDSGYPVATRSPASCDNLKEYLEHLKKKKDAKQESATWVISTESNGKRNWEKINN